jgi:hypothetical protein
MTLVTVDAVVNVARNVIVIEVRSVIAAVATGALEN